jgi:acetyl-CoA acyltransferase
MRDAVIVAAVRTPVGKRNGGLSGVHPADLSATVLSGLEKRVGIDPALVDDVVWGCVSQVGEQTLDIARSAVLGAGWPESVTGVTVARQCGSSQQAVHFAAAGVIAGDYDVVVAGGVESMSRVPMGSSAGDAWPFGEGFRARYEGTYPNQGIAAEMVAERWKFSRTELDEFSLASHSKAAAAQDEGRFDEQIVAVTGSGGAQIRADEGIPPRRIGGGPSRPEAGIPARRCDHHQRGSQAARAGPAGPGPHGGGGRCRSGAHADRADPGDAESVAAQRAVYRPDRRFRGERGVRAGTDGLAG